MGEEILMTCKCLCSVTVKQRECLSCRGRVKYTPGSNQSALFTAAVCLMRSPRCTPAKISCRSVGVRNHSGKFPDQQAGQSKAATIYQRRQLHGLTVRSKEEEEKGY
ncbi:hypothetical protein AMECASPLE_034992 [Ameca splendens]|uniref:Uncharacterized protein n=1 Tax=Ameca splendens TaxID=208324 RepID=A0ABV0XW57_9TELE